MLVVIVPAKGGAYHGFLDGSVTFLPDGNDRLFLMEFVRRRNNAPTRQYGEPKLEAQPQAVTP
jgi:hypothetical protein